MSAARNLDVDATFSLAQTCGPVAWVGERSPRHRWSDGALTWVGWEEGRVVWRQARQLHRVQLDITGDSNPSLDAEWARTVLGVDIGYPAWSDPVVSSLATRFPGMRPYCDGSLFEGLITSIVGQSISVAAAAVTQAKLAALFSDGVEIDGRLFRPLPSAAMLAESAPGRIRLSGVTTRRAEALHLIAREAVAGNLPPSDDARRDPDAVVRELVRLPLVGRWTAESTVLWGTGAPNAHPTGDVALLRAARAAYGVPDWTLKDLDVVAERWQPARGLAARLLWLGLFGPASVA